MSFPLTSPTPKVDPATILAAEYNSIDLKTSRATDGRKNPDELPALNIQRIVGPFGAANVHDLVWDPVAKRFVLITEVTNEARLFSTPDFISLPTHLAIGDHYFGGSDYSGDRIVVVQNTAGAGLVQFGDTMSGFTVASTNPGVQLGRPIYAWDIDTWVVAGQADSVFYSTDGGDNWAGALTPPTNTSTEKYMTPATDGTRVLLGMTGASTTGYAWSDDGDEWTDGTLPNTVEESQFAYDPYGQKWVCAGKTPSVNGFRCFVSSDGGETFTLSGAHTTIIGADLDSIGNGRVMGIGFVSGVLLVALNTGRVLGSGDYGATFSDLGRNMHVTIGHVAEKCRILSNPFGPNMYLSYGSVGTGGPAAFRQDMFTSLRNRL